LVIEVFEKMSQIKLLSFTVWKLGISLVSIATIVSCYSKAM